MILDLRKQSGLGLEFDTDKIQMSFDSDLTPVKPAVRTINQMREVLLDKGIQQPEELYYMYRDLHRLSDEANLRKHNLRYDVTVIKPACLGNELMKTAGHYHPESFGELYEVVFGRCFCLLQQPDIENHQIIKQVILVEAVAGEKIVIPPGFGHILINPGPDFLVTSNWVSNRFASEYELYKKADGAAYFFTRSTNKMEITPRLKVKLGISKNPYFKQAADVQFVSPAPGLERFGLVTDSPIYNLINGAVQKLDFLNRPLDFEYADVFLKVASSNRG